MTPARRSSLPQLLRVQHRQGGVAAAALDSRQLAAGRPWPVSPQAARLRHRDLNDLSPARNAFIAAMRGSVVVVLPWAGSRCRNSSLPRPMGRATYVASRRCTTRRGCRTSHSVLVGRTWKDCAGRGMHPLRARDGAVRPGIAAADGAARRPCDAVESTLQRHKSIVKVT